jgi:hypothetical protein
VRHKLSLQLYNKLVYLSNQLTSSLYTTYKLYTWGNFRIQYQIQIGALSTRHSQNLHTYAESIELFIKDQASSSSYDLAPHPTSTPPSPVSKLSLFISLPVCRWSSLLTGKGVGRWWGRSQIIRPRESLVLYKSFCTPWYVLLYVLYIFHVLKIVFKNIVLFCQCLE